VSAPSNNKKESAAPFAYEGLERVIHERARLSILSSLAAHPQGLVFNDLKSLCALTDGNLSRQIQLLQEAGFVEVWKGTKNNRPQTLCRLTDSGKKRFLEYIAELEQVVANAMTTGKQEEPRKTPKGRLSLA
jgi:DNA-binding MarR family transcriptional regulator